jgi:hypothetical protein
MVDDTTAAVSSSKPRFSRSRGMPTVATFRDEEREFLGIGSTVAACPAIVAPARR